MKIHRSKQQSNILHSVGVTGSYDEILRFKRSAAKVATIDVTLTGICNADSGLVQVVVDNFDADISSQNGKLATHSLAVPLTKPETQVTGQKCHKPLEEITKKIGLTN